MKWFQIMDGHWWRHARKARELQLTVHHTRQTGVFRVPSSRRVCDYEVIIEDDRVSCLCAAETRCMHAGLVVEYVIGYDMRFDLNQYQYLVRMEMVNLLARYYRDELSYADREEVRRCLKVGEEVLERLDVQIPDEIPTVIHAF